MPVLQLEEYNISIGTIGQQHIKWLQEQQFAGIVVLTDTNTAHYCWPKIQPLLAPLAPLLITVDAGEQSKNLNSCRFIWEQLFEIAAGRNWCILNLGGGVIGDMGGFCAGTYKRGIHFIQVPTTLLAQVDASVGGKLGIDFYGVKNSIGLFCNPRAVWADPGFFATLPSRELRSGFAEIIKHALIADASQWEELSTTTNWSDTNWADWVTRSVAIKQKIVTADPHEKGWRKALNFGHTIGHAIESYFLETTSPLLHGEAIAAGMICEAWLSTQQTGLTAEALESISGFFLKVYGHQHIPEAIWPQLLATMRQDKKNEDTRINFSLLNAIGKAKVNETAREDLIVASLRYYNNLGRV